jgi:hypothetical protein
MSKPEPKPAAVLAEWTERDLTAAAAAGELPVAWEVELYLEQLADLLDAGRHPIVVGEPGVLGRRGGQQWPQAPWSRGLLGLELATDGTVPRLKDALRGELGPLLEAWRRRHAEGR